MAATGANERVQRYLASPLPTWLAVPVLATATVGVSIWLADARHPAVGLLAGLFYGILFGVGTLARDRMLAWTARHRLLDSLLLFPMLAFAVLTFTSWPAWVCLALTAAFAIPLVALAAVLRRRRGTTEIDL